MTDQVATDHIGTDSSSVRAASAALAHVLVSPLWLAEHLDDPKVRVVEVDVSRAAYDQGHISGAVLWNAYTDLHDPDYRPVDRTEFGALLSRSGLTPDATIVFYGYGPSLGFWLTKAYGHERALVLTGTRDDARVVGIPWTTEAPTPTPSAYTIPAMESSSLISLEMLQGSLGQEEPLILDVRSEAEFAGERFWPSGTTVGAGRAGHIPGAVHLPVNLLRAADGAFKQPAELRQLFHACGVVPERSIVTYCTIGNRASEVALVLRYLLGYPNVRVYDGSWAQWGTQKETPVV